MDVNRLIPISFEKVQEFDSRFQKVKIWLMHTNENFNKSFFEKSIVEENMHTIANMPILGFIEESKLGDVDFKAHESEYYIEDGELKEKYIGNAYGIIPESCNPRFEWKETGDGEWKEYLVVDGLIWTQFEDVVKIFNDSNGKVNQSMELSDEFDGYFDDNNIFHFTKFKFKGACMLGSNYQPAMKNASVETVFSMNKYFEKEITDKLDEFNKLFGSLNEDNKVVEKSMDELLQKYSLTKEDLVKKGINFEDLSLDELESKIQEFSQVEPDPEPVDPEPVDPEPVDPEPVDPEPVLDKYTLTFELSHEDVRSKMYESLREHMKPHNKTDDEYNYYWINSVFDSYFVASDDYGNNYMVSYMKQNDSVVLGDVVEVYAMYLTSDEKGALELMRSNYEKFEAENNKLKEFKEQIEYQQHVEEIESLFSQAQFAKLTDEDLKDLRDNVKNYSVNQIEAKLYELVGRKTTTFSRKKEDTSIKINFNKANEDEGSYRSSVQDIFARNGFKPIN